MNHPSEWTKSFDEKTGRYRYKHKGSGLIRDTLMTIGKAFKGTAKNVVKTAADKAAKTVAEKAGQKVGEIAVEKGSKQIQQILRKRKPKPQKVAQDAKKKTRSMSSYFFNKPGNKILIRNTLTSLTHLISTVITRQD